MAKINREYILKTFFEKVKEAKRQGMKEIKIPINFLDDMSTVLYQILSEDISKLLDKIDSLNEEKQIQQESPKLKKRVFKEIQIKKPVVENALEIKEEIVEEEKPIEVKEIIENEQKIDNDIENNEEEDDEDDEGGITLYGGSW